MNSYYINATQKDTLSLFYHTIKERVHCIYRDNMFPPMSTSLRSIMGPKVRLNPSQFSELLNYNLLMVFLNACLIYNQITYLKNWFS